MDKTLKYPRGSALQFTSGEYSDFDVDAFLITIKDCDLPALAQAFVKEDRERRADEWDAGRHDGFGAWLIANGYAMPGEVSTVHLGSYGEWECEFGVPAKTDE